MNQRRTHSLFREIALGHTQVQGRLEIQILEEGHPGLCVCCLGRWPLELTGRDGGEG